MMQTDVVAQKKLNSGLMKQDINTRRKRLLYIASYRGFKEADLLIGGFARAHLNAMDEAELDEFDALLKLNDRELYAYAIGAAEPPSEMMGQVLEKLKAFKLSL